MIICDCNKECRPTKYRREHPEWRGQEKIRNQQRQNLKYQPDPEYRLKQQQQALARHNMSKEAKINTSLSAN